MGRIIIGGCLILFLPMLVFAQEKVEAPVWNIGDKWDFGQEGFLEVIGVDNNGFVANFSAGIFLKSARGTAIFDKSNFNILYVLEGDKAKKYSGGFRRILNFPLVIGKNWNDEFIRRSTDGRHDNPTAETIKVLGWEEVVVHTGKFRAIKLEYQINYGPVGLGPIYESKAWFWYSPEVKYFLKGQYGKGYLEPGNPMDPSSTAERDDWKLISLKLRK